MKAIVVMYDTLNRLYLSPYGADEERTPNFARLAKRCAVFDKYFVGSLPCIPARRELHTGRLNFLHRSWGPLEPFDDSMPEILKKNGVYTHICTDHLHYFEEGGATYHQRYCSWELARGQEGDPWKADVRSVAEVGAGRYAAQDRYNRTYIRDEADFPQTKTFQSGVAFIDRNHSADNWMLTVETFDPHEPFYVPEPYRSRYPELSDMEYPDWPGGGMDAEEIRKTRVPYSALIEMCDANLGKILDRMDRYRLWQDTMLIVLTDHGFLLGEHGGVGKVPRPYYSQVCNTPFLVWDPRCGAIGGRSALAQSIDIAPTLLSYFGVRVPKDMLGADLAEAIRADTPVRRDLLFGVHSHCVCISDGRYIYARAPRDRERSPIYNYTLMPTHMHAFFSNAELATAEMAGPFSFTKGLRVLRTAAGDWPPIELPERDLLFDTQADPEQNEPIHNPGIEADMADRMKRLMRENDAPEELYTRLGL